jgi:hypothetical protein
MMQTPAWFKALMVALCLVFGAAMIVSAHVVIGCELSRERCHAD